MEGVVLLVVILGFFIINNNLNSKFRFLEKTIEELNDRIKYLQEKLTTQSFTVEEKEEVVYEKDIEKESPVIKTEVFKENTSEIIEKPIIEEVIPVKEELIIEEKLTIEEEPINISFEEGELLEENTVEETVREPEKPWIDRFKEKNPDLEKFIGENLINKIGILILVLGISFFVKYAIDKDWINEPARVGIGILSGALVMGIAHKLKKNYMAFSSVLVAGAISIFYFTIYIAFHEYELFSQTVAFIIMAVITAFSALVSVSYNRQELAVLSLIGGFAAPFMLSTGEGNYIVLFSYIAILNIGILAISYFKKWKIATILDFVFTLVLFGAWCFTKIGTDQFSHKGALIFATLFYFIFSITIVLSNLKNKGVFTTIEYFILIANTFFFFGTGMFILKDLDSNYTGLFTLMLGIYNILYAGILYKKFGLDKNAVYLLIGLALTFATLTIPIQFEGNQITIFWALEVVLLFWLSQKSKINSFKIGALIVQSLTLISLLMDWRLYSWYGIDLSLIINPLFIAGFVVSVSLFFTYWLLRKETVFTTKLFTLPMETYKILVLTLAVVITYMTGILEVNYQAKQYLLNDYSALSFPVTYHFVFIATLIYLSITFKKEEVQKGILIIGIISLVSYIVHFYGIPKNEIIENFVINTSSNYAFYFHYIILACLIYIGYVLFKKNVLLFHVKAKQNKWLPWVFVFAVVYILSNEIMVHGLKFSDNVNTSEFVDLYNNENSNDYKIQSLVKEDVHETATQIIKIGYPILWGVFSFVFLIIGIKKQWKTLRIIALALLGITVVKLFAYDIKNVSETGKIIAFILLGVLILVISFVYQKIKKLVVDEDTTQPKEEKHDEI